MDDRAHEDLIVSNLVNTYSYLRRIGKSHNQITDMFLVAILKGFREISLFELQRPIERPEAIK